MKAKGCHLYSADGQKYLDLSAAIDRPLGYRPALKLKKPIIKTNLNGFQPDQAAALKLSRRFSAFFSSFELDKQDYRTYVLDQVNYQRFFSLYTDLELNCEGIECISALSGMKGSGNEGLTLVSDLTEYFTPHEGQKSNGRLLYLSSLINNRFLAAETATSYDHLILDMTSFGLSNLILFSRKELPLFHLGANQAAELYQKYLARKERAAARKSAMSLDSYLKQEIDKLQKSDLIKAVTGGNCLYRITIGAIYTAQRTFHKNTSFLANGKYIYLALPYDIKANHLPSRIKELKKILENSQG